MYDDPRFIRDKPVRCYFNEPEKAEIEQAARASGRERAAFIRDATLVVARYIRSRNEGDRADAIHRVQVRLTAANDPHTRFCLAS